MKKTVLIFLTLICTFVGFCSLPLNSVVSIQLTLTDQENSKITKGALVIFLDQENNEIKKIKFRDAHKRDAGNGSFDNTIVLTGGHHDTALTSTSVKNIAKAIIEVPHCETKEMPISFIRKYVGFSPSPHGGGAAYMMHSFIKEVALECNTHKRKTLLFDLGNYWDYGWKTKADLQGDVRAQQDYRQKARQGDPHAVLQAGLLAYEDQDFSTAFHRFSQAAERGQPIAMAGLGALFYNAQGTLLNLKKSAEWYKRSADAGYPFAQYYLARLYEEGEGVEKSASQACHWYKKAASEGFSVIKAQERFDALSKQALCK